MSKSSATHILRVRKPNNGSTVGTLSDYGLFVSNLFPSLIYGLANPDLFSYNLGSIDPFSKLEEGVGETLAHLGDYLGDFFI